MTATSIRFQVPTVKSGPGSALLDRLHGKIERHLQLVSECELWRTLSSPETSAEVMGRILKHLMLESFSFGPHAVRSMLGAIARFPHTHYNLCKLAFHTVIEEIPP